MGNSLCELPSDSRSESPTLTESVAAGLRVAFAGASSARTRGVAIVTAFYEVLTTMAAGALLAALIFLVQPPTWSGLRLNPLYTGLLLLVVLAVPLWPGVFNYLVGRLAARFQKLEVFRQPRLTPRILAEGLAITGIGWIFLGASVGAMLWAVLPDPPDWTLQTQTRWMATIGLAYVAGFLAFIHL